jgi:hypothetical protein
MSRVFITQIPNRRGENNVWLPIIDITPAKKFGEVITLLPAQSRNLQQDELSISLSRLLDEYRFSADDFLMPLGSPALMATASILASRRLRDKPLKLLVWDKQNKAYYCHEVRV